MDIKLKALLLAKYFAKDRVEGDPLLDTLFELDDYAAKIYQENRLKSFGGATLLSHQLLIEKVLSDDFMFSQKVMTWDDKCKMNEALSSSNYAEGTKIFYKNLDIIDEQAVEMFIAGIEITEEALLPQIEMHKVIAESLRKFKLTRVGQIFRKSNYVNVVWDIRKDKL